MRAYVTLLFVLLRSFSTRAQCQSDFSAVFSADFIQADSTLRPFGSLGSTTCLKVSGSNVVLSKCQNSAKFEWAYDTKTKQIKSLQSTGDDAGLCWTAKHTKNGRQNVKLSACNTGNKLQRFKQVSGRLHLVSKTKLCVMFDHHSAQASMDKSKKLTIAQCQGQIFGNGKISKSSCTGSADSVAQIVSLLSSSGFMKTLVNEHSAGNCMYRQGGSAKFGKCKNSGAYKLEMTSDGKIKQKGSNYCLTVTNTAKAATVNMKKCSKQLKNKQEFVWSDGRVLLRQNTRFALQYMTQKAKGGGSFIVKTGRAYGSVFGNVFAGVEVVSTTTQATTVSSTTMTTQAPVLGCDSAPCQNGATCTSIGEQYSCECGDAFTGINCDRVVLACDANPCENGGICTDDGSHIEYSCECGDTFTGVNCHTAVLACDANPCENGGICTDGGSHIEYSCECGDAFSGVNCHTDVLACNANPCENGGICTDDGSHIEYSCECPDTHWGSNCEAQKPCVSAPCLNDGICTDVADANYECTCSASYTGVNCETEVVSDLPYPAAYKPNAEEELLAQLIIRTMFRNEGKYREGLPFETALLKQVQPHAIRMAFHLNMDEANGCVDNMHGFNKGLGHFANRIDAAYKLFHDVYQLIYTIDTIENPLDGSLMARAAEKHCRRKEWGDIFEQCRPQCDWDAPLTKECKGMFYDWNYGGVNGLVRALGTDDYWKANAIHVDYDHENNESRMTELVDIVMGFIVNVYRSSTNKWAQNVPLINQADFTNTVFVEALYDVMPRQYHPHCKARRAQNYDWAADPESNNNPDGYLPTIQSRTLGECYEEGLTTRQEEFLVHYTDPINHIPNTYGRRFAGMCNDEAKCGCTVAPDSTPDPSQVLDHNYERMHLKFPGITLQEFLVLIGAHSLGAVHTNVSGGSTGTWVPDGEKLTEQFIHRITKWGYFWKQHKFKNANDGSDQVELRQFEVEGCTHDCYCDEETCMAECREYFDASVIDDVEEFICENCDSEDGEIVLNDCSKPWLVAKGFQHCTPQICDYSTAEIIERVATKGNRTATFNLIALPSDVTISRNFTRTAADPTLLEASTGQPFMGFARDANYDKRSFPHILGKYINTRVNMFNDTYASELPIPFNEQDPTYKRWQGFPVRFQFDFWKAFGKMIQNGYKGGFSGAGPELTDTADQVDTVREMCSKVFLKINYAGSRESFNNWDMINLCRVAIDEQGKLYKMDGTGQEDQAVMSDFINYE